MAKTKDLVGFSDNALIRVEIVGMEKAHDLKDTLVKIKVHRPSFWRSLAFLCQYARQEHIPITRWPAAAVVTVRHAWLLSRA